MEESDHSGLSDELRLTDLMEDVLNDYDEEIDEIRARIGKLSNVLDRKVRIVEEIREAMSAIDSSRQNPTLVYSKSKFLRRKEFEGICVSDECILMEMRVSIPYKNKPFDITQYKLLDKYAIFTSVGESKDSVQKLRNRSIVTSKLFQRPGFSLMKKYIDKSSIRYVIGDRSALTAISRVPFLFLYTDDSIDECELSDVIYSIINGDLESLTKSLDNICF